MHNKVILIVLAFFIVIEAGLCILALNITPLKLKRNVFTFQYGEEISSNVGDYVIANESILESISLNIKDVSMDVGVYQASVSYFDKTYPFEIHIIDTIKPKAELKQIEWDILVGEEIFAKDLVTNIEDKSSTTIYFLDEDTDEKNESLTFLEQGSYVEKIIVEDVHGNHSAALRVKIVVGVFDAKPVIQGISDMVVKLGENIDLSAGVKAIDSEDGDITSHMVILGYVDVHTVGEYSVTYSVEDSKGNVTSVVRTIIVE